MFQWNPGDGNDTIEGQDGADTMLFFGSNAAENIDVVANGGRVLFLRNVANVTMDLDDVESIDFQALGGADNVVVGDLSGTDLTRAGLDLRGPNGGGDGAADTITANGSNGADVFGAAGDAGGVDVFGLQAEINVSFQEQANDRLTLNALGGSDTVNATSLEADGIQLTMNGGLGDDLFLGSEGDDLINGGDGDDVALMGAGGDTFVWNPGDDDDTLEGQDGADTMLFSGANAAENIDISPNGGRVLFFRDIASVTMDLNDVESIDFLALGGADTIVVDDLSGTDVNAVNTDLAGTAGGVGDGQPDTVIIHGTERRRRQPRLRRRLGRVRDRTGRAGEHRRLGGRQRPARDQRAGRRRRGRGLGPLGRGDPAHGRRRRGGRRPRRQRRRRRAAGRPG